MSQKSSVKHFLGQIVSRMRWWPVPPAPLVAPDTALLPFSLPSSCCLPHSLTTLPYKAPLKQLSVFIVNLSKKFDSMATVRVITAHRRYRDHLYCHHSMIRAATALHHLQLVTTQLKDFMRQNADGFSEGPAIMGWMRHVGTECSSLCTSGSVLTSNASQSF